MKREGPSTRAIWLASAAAALPVLVAGLPLEPAVANATAQFAPPSDPMLLTRTLRRPLSGGAEVLTRRSYEIRFVPEGGGYRVEGRLVDVEVAAPPNLQPLASLERRRPDEGMFPMRLDARGSLQPQDAALQADEVRQAGRSLRESVGSLGLQSFDEAQAANFAGSFEQRSARTVWPEDLFRPAPGPREETRTVPLPNGARGTVRVTIDATTHGASGLLSSFVRRVVTDLEGDNRITEETWTLSAKS